MKATRPLVLSTLAALALASCKPGGSAPPTVSANAPLQGAVERFVAYDTGGEEMERLLRGARQAQAADPALAQEDADKALFLLARKLSRYAREGDWSHQVHVDFLALLLDKGANPLAPGGEGGFSCAADALAARPTFLKALAARGYIISPPPHLFREETLIGQLQAIPTEAIRTEEAAAQYELLASLFTRQAEAMPTDINTGLACAAALRLMHRADAPRTVELISEHPLWRDAAAWERLEDTLHEGATHPRSHQLRCLLMALRGTPELIVPAERAMKLAEDSAAEGNDLAAHLFIRLLGRDPMADERIEKLCADDGKPLALRSAAWSVKLQRAGLPCLPSCGIFGQEGANVAGWLSGKYRAGNANDKSFVAPIAQALLAEKSGHGPGTIYFPQELFELSAAFQPTEGAQQERIAEALRAIGAPAAAARYDGLRHADEARRKELRADRQAATAASLELELALAKHIWQHRNAFLHEPWDAAAPAEAGEPHVSRR